MDREFQRALDAGAVNQRIIELAQNWCGHITCEKYGGTGFIEQQTGLPIGMRRFKCPNASAAGMAGGGLRFVALDFYDRNCAVCEKRLPVRLPNLSEIVAERDRARQVATEEGLRAAREEADGIEHRAVRRKTLVIGSEPATAGIFDLIDKLDRDPNEENRNILLETAAAAPLRFTGAVLEALFELAAQTTLSRGEAALEVLAALNAERDALRSCSASLSGQNWASRCCGYCS